MAKLDFKYSTEISQYTDCTIVNTVYYPRNRRELLRIYRNIRKHRYLLVNEGYGMNGTKTKIWGTLLKGTFDTRKGRLYIRYTLYNRRPVYVVEPDEDLDDNYPDYVEIFGEDSNDECM